MIELSSVSKHFGSSRAVDDISFHINEGETFVLLGTSGCGKTTTLRMINRLIEPSSGSVRVNGSDVTTQQPENLRRNIGYVLQHNSLFPHYTIAENIAIVPGLLRWDKQRIEIRTRELINKLHLKESYLQKYPSELSGGEQQRVNIARALAANPPVLLMDEPFGALDTVTRTKVRKEFMELDELRKKTTVMVTHDVEEAFEMGDKICLMDKGQIIQVGTKKELLFTPANDFVKRFFEKDMLQLTLKAVTVGDIWRHLDGQNLPENGTATKISVEKKLWDVLDRATNNGESTYIAVVNKNDEVKYVNWNQVMNAFNQYKANA